MKFPVFCGFQFQYHSYVVLFTFMENSITKAECSTVLCLKYFCRKISAEFSNSEIILKIILLLISYCTTYLEIFLKSCCTLQSGYIFTETDISQRIGSIICQMRPLGLLTYKTSERQNGKKSLYPVYYTGKPCCLSIAKCFAKNMVCSQFTTKPVQ